MTAVPTAARVRRLQVPERTAELGVSLGAAERALDAAVGPGALNLTHTDMRRFPPPPWAAEELAAASPTAPVFTAYRGDAAVRAALAPRLSRFLGCDVDPERELIVTPGTQGALFAALAVLVETGAPVAVLTPDYLSTERTIRFFGGRPIHVPIVRAGDRLEVDLDALEAAFVAGARLLVCSNPNNPTGAVFGEACLRGIASLVAAADACAVVDELYSRLVFDGGAFIHVRSLDEMRERSVTLLGPSKTESMSGYRLGVAVAPPQVVEAMEDVQAVATLRAPAYAQQLLHRWLRDDASFVEARVRELRELRDLAVAALSELECVQLDPPAATTYAFVRVPGSPVRHNELARHLYDRAQVVVTPGYAFGPQEDASFRICFAQDREALRGGLARIGRTLEALCARERVG